jgi:hypothetical protein
MDHLTCNFSNTPEHLESTPVPVTRRRFFTYLTGGAAAMALQGCGAGYNIAITMTPNSTAPTTPTTPVTPPPVDTPTEPPPVIPTVPVTTITWQTIPPIAFTQGVAGTFSIADYVTVANATALSLTRNAASLPPGVTFDSVNRLFRYDGSGAVAASDGVVLTATVG